MRRRTEDFRGAGKLARYTGGMAGSPPTSTVNRYGRRGGRGRRPWLLLPKVVSVSAYWGSLAAAVYVWIAGDGSAAAAGLVRGLLAHVAAPALFVAAVLGVLLMVEPGVRVMFRQRWLRVKLLVLAVGVPGLWVWIDRALWRAERMGAAVDRSAWWNVTAAMAVALAASLAVIVLGRHKPRLGQNWAKAFRER